MPVTRDVVVLLLNHNFASTALGPIEAFHSAGRLWHELQGESPEPRFRVTVASLDGRAVETPYALKLAPQLAMETVEHADIIVVPASGQDFDAQFARHGAMFPWLRRWYDEGAYIASVCSGAAYLAEAGLLDGRLATTHWAVATELARRYPGVRWEPDMMITEDNRVLCSGGVYASIDISLYLIERICGHEIAVQTAKGLLVDMPRTCQTAYAVLPLSRPHADARIREVEHFMQQHLAESLPTHELAGHACMSPRTLLRRFKAATGRLPGEYLQLLRIRTARDLLEESGDPVQTISTAVGYEDAAFFRKLFKRHTGMTPAEYRTRFGRVRKAGAERAADPPEGASAA